jgi:hypothetical protein
MSMGFLHIKKASPETPKPPYEFLMKGSCSRAAWTWHKAKRSDDCMALGTQIAWLQQVVLGLMLYTNLNELPKARPVDSTHFCDDRGRNSFNLEPAGDFKRSNHHYLKQMCICSTQVDELMAVAHSKPEEAGCEGLVDRFGEA